MRAVRAGGAAPEKCACRLDPLDREALTTAIEREVAVTFIEARPSTVVVTAQDGTTMGTYTINVSGTSGSTTATASIQLVVQ